MTEKVEERRCPYEVCKLLHEKGFDVKCTLWYWENNTNIWEPTQQMACDWMRTKDVLITYDLAPFSGKNLMVKVYKRLYDDPYFLWTEAITIIRDNLEDAINEALKFALNKLI